MKIPQVASACIAHANASTAPSYSSGCTTYYGGQKRSSLMFLESADSSSLGIACRLVKYDLTLTTFSFLFSLHLDFHALSFKFSEQPIILFFLQILFIFF